MAVCSPIRVRESALVAERAVSTEKGYLADYT